MVVYLLLRNADDLKCLPKGVTSRVVALLPEGQSTSTKVLLRRIFDENAQQREIVKVGIIIVEKESFSPNRSEVLKAVLELSQNHRLEVFQTGRWYSASTKHLNGLVSQPEFSFKVDDVHYIDIWLSNKGQIKPTLHDEVAISLDARDGALSLEQTSQMLGILNFTKPSNKYEEFISKAFTPITINPQADGQARTPSTLNSLGHFLKPPQPPAAAKASSRKSEQGSADNHASQGSNIDVVSLQAKQNEDLKIKIKAREEVCRSLFLSNKLLKSQLEKVEGQLSSSKKGNDGVLTTAIKLKSFEFLEAGMLSKKPSLEACIPSKPTTSKALLDQFIAGSPSRQSSITGFSAKQPRSAVKETQTTDRRGSCIEIKADIKGSTPLLLHPGTFGDFKITIPNREPVNLDKGIQTQSKQGLELSVKKLTSQMIIPMKVRTVLHQNSPIKREPEKLVAQKVPSSTRKQLGICFGSSDHSRSSVTELSRSVDTQRQDASSPLPKYKNTGARRPSDAKSRIHTGLDFKSSLEFNRTAVDDIHKTLLEMDLKFLQQESKLNVSLGGLFRSNAHLQGATRSAVGSADPLAGKPHLESSPGTNWGRRLKITPKPTLERYGARPISSELESGLRAEGDGWRRRSTESPWQRSRTETGVRDSGGNPLAGFRQQRDSLLLGQMQARMDKWNSFQRNRHNN